MSILDEVKSLGIMEVPIAIRHLKGTGTLVVNGQANISEDIRVQNLTITGSVQCKSIVVSGVLAVKNGASVFAESIIYGSLVVEPKASLNGNMECFGSVVEKKDA